jgi:hypothetical protein
VIARWTLVAATLLTLIGCAALDPRPKGSVVIYGRNDAPGIAWFGLVPLTDPPETVGFGPDMGVACLVGPAGAEIVAFDTDPGRGGRPELVLGRKPGGADPAVVWVDVAADGSVTSGFGVPQWWQGDPQICPAG